MPQLYRNLAAAALLLLPWSAVAASPEPTLETIMAHPDWIGNPPEEPYWADDGRSVFYLRKRTGEEQKDLIRVDLESGTQSLVSLGERGKTDAPGGDLSRDRRWKTYARQGDIFLKDLQTGTIRQITRTEEEEEAPRFLVGDNRIAFQRGAGGGTTFVFDLVAGTLFQPADLKLVKDPAEDEEAGYIDEQQERLFQVIKENKDKQAAEREEDRASRHLDPTRAPLPWFLGEEVEIVQSSLSPSGDWMLVVIQAKGAAKKPSLMARFVTEDGNLKSDEVRAKVGTEPPIDHKILLLDLVKHEKHEVDLSQLPGITEDPLKELREKAQKAKDQAKEKDSKDARKKEEKKEEEKKPRPVEVWALSWSDDGRYGALMLHASDNKDRWIATVEREKPAPVSRHRLTDPAWINWDFNELGWLPESDTLWYNSEETGHSNLYLVSMKESKARRIVEGDFEVSHIVASRDGKHLYYRANQSHPGIHDVWRVPVSGGGIGGRAEQLSKTGGETFFELSPDESRLLLLHSTTTRHGDLFVQPNEPGAEARRITETHSPEFLAIEWSRPEIVPIPSSQVKKPIWSRVYTPAGFDPSRKYPAVVFTHGAGYLQNAHAGWSSYFREFMFHTLLTRRGYVVLDMDYRASAGYGRDWRTAIYRQMGHPEVEDLEDGVAWLVENKSVDPRRVGTYGGSYGGFLTFMSLFRKPDLFAAGAALRPVTDWAFYNHEYTSNILNTPEVDPEAFAKSSPIEYAQGLTKPLLICTGMVDDNVFFQDSVRLVQRLIELKKENFETAVYPVEPHAFRQPTSWLDEYRRIFKLFETHLK